MRKILKIVSLGLVALAFAGQAEAAECTPRQKASLAKALAARESAYLELQILAARRQAEVSNQAAITAAFEQKFRTATTSLSFVPSIRSVVDIEIGKRVQKMRADRLKESQKILEKLNREVLTAEKKATKAANKAISPTTCTVTS